MRSFDFSVSETVLLTGAGFTHNFGGFLASGMWAEIHNNFLRHYSRPDNSRMIEEIKNKFNYEDLYQSIGDSNEYTTEQKAAFIDSVHNAYDTLDEIVRSYQNKIVSQTYDINTHAIADFIRQLMGGNREHGFFFSLNQDIFVERYIRKLIKSESLVCPGIKDNYARFNIGADKQLLSSDFQMVLRNQALEKAKTDFCRSPDRIHYIKLHGSYDWWDGNDKTKMIIGTSKPGQIEKEPLLTWYFQLFKEVLVLGNQRLMIIGYGFGDPHINDVIIDAIKQHNLKIYVISPNDPKNFRTKVDKIDDNIFRAISGYYQCSLRELFSIVGSSPHYINLKKEFFFL